MRFWEKRFIVYFYLSHRAPDYPFDCPFKVRVCKHLFKYEVRLGAGWRVSISEYVVFSDGKHFSLCLGRFWNWDIPEPSWTNVLVWINQPVSIIKNSKWLLLCLATFDSSPQWPQSTRINTAKPTWALSNVWTYISVFTVQYVMSVSWHAFRFNVY